MVIIAAHPENTEGPVWEPASDRRAPPIAEEMHPGGWWHPEEVALPRRCITRRTIRARRKSRSHKGRMVEKRRRHKGPRSETAATSRKREGIQQNPRAADREASSPVFHRAARSEWLDIMKGSAPSEMKEDDRGTPGSAHNLSWSCSGRAALRRKQRKQLETNHRENRVTATSQTHPSEKMKWRYACRLFGTISLNKGAMWHIDRC
jgi:hypothetical protein